MDRIFFENVRCFSGKHSAPIRPITLLIGENSTGKSTFLALLRCTWSLLDGDQNLSLNRPPFSLGNFDQIVATSEFAPATEPYFIIGSELGLRNDEVGPDFYIRMFGNNPIRVWREYVAKDALPHSRRLIVEQDGASLEYDWIAKKLWFNRSSQRLLIRTLLDESDLSPIRFLDETPLDTESHSIANNLSLAVTLFRDFVSVFEREPYAFAPIRSEAKRTYDPLTDSPEPQGSHVPVVLSRALNNENGAVEHLGSALDGFGKLSGLFDSLQVRRLGKGPGDPFQITVKIAGPERNLVDVGYGVSQILPILVDTFRDERPRTYLLQQPEVHLHPRAQAALGSFLANISITTKKRFVIETHSDYIVDRVRMEVRDNPNITPDDVVILYFEREGQDVKIHEIYLDDQGNLLNVPPGYRDFFMHERLRLLGIPQE